MSICTGAFVHGAAGLLDGRRATTNWAHAESFRRLYPQVELDENVLFVDEGGSPPASTCAFTSSVLTTAARWPTTPPGTAWCRRGETAGSRSSSSAHCPSSTRAVPRRPGRGRWNGSANHLTWQRWRNTRE
ncbi:MAG TPA: hypothetical protein VJT49_01255 [Amycolatopsis sp.]|nr:hypothetical protein [Amycolatopsis sp.]HKS43740.1 hypothetical protein [Amycolatopsis sp.]